MDYRLCWQIIIPIDVWSVAFVDGLSPAERIVMQKYIIPRQQPNSRRIIFPFLFSSRIFVVFCAIINNLCVSRCPEKGLHSQCADNEIAATEHVGNTLAINVLHASIPTGHVDNTLVIKVLHTSAVAGHIVNTLIINVLHASAVGAGFIPVLLQRLGIVRKNRDSV